MCCTLKVLILHSCFIAKMQALYYLVDCTVVSKDVSRVLTGRLYSGLTYSQMWRNGFLERHGSCIMKVYLDGHLAGQRVAITLKKYFSA